MAENDGFFRRQMSDSLVTAAFVVLSGGFQDAYTYCCRGKVFANAQTGNIVLMSANLLSGEAARSVKYIVPLLSFLLGIMAAEWVHCRFKSYEKIHWRQMILAVEIALLFGVGFLPQSANSLATRLFPSSVRFRCSPFTRCTAAFTQAPCVSATCAAARRRFSPFSTPAKRRRCKRH